VLGLVIVAIGLLRLGKDGPIAITVPSGLRFRAKRVAALDRLFTPSAAGTTRELHFSFRKSDQRSEVRSYTVNVERGYIKFVAPDGFLKFLPDDVVEARGGDTPPEVRVQFRKGDCNIWIGSGGMGMNLVGIVVPEDSVHHHKGAENLFHRLPTREHGNRDVTELVVEFSADFSGYIMDWEVPPNWK
jgi:hypothetical protein